MHRDEKQKSTQRQWLFDPAVECYLFVFALRACSNF